MINRWKLWFFISKTVDFKYFISVSSSTEPLTLKRKVTHLHFFQLSKVRFCSFKVI